MKTRLIFLGLLSLSTFAFASFAPVKIYVKRDSGGFLIRVVNKCMTSPHTHAVVEPGALAGTFKISDPTLKCAHELKDLAAKWDAGKPGELAAIYADKKHLAKQASEASDQMKSFSPSVTARPAQACSCVLLEGQGASEAAEKLAQSK